jgi:hypothetical protein
MYVALLSEPSHVLDHGEHGRNVDSSVTVYLEPLAISLNWRENVGVSAATTKAHEIRCMLEKRKLTALAPESETLLALREWTSTSKTAPYLLRDPAMYWTLTP